MIDACSFEIESDVKHDEKLNGSKTLIESSPPNIVLSNTTQFEETYSIKEDYENCEK